jgi:hypothetical protein
MTYDGICEACGKKNPCDLCLGKRSEIFEYKKDDYLLVNKVGEVVAVSGNSEFDPPTSPSGPYVVVKVVESSWISNETR